MLPQPPPDRPKASPHLTGSLSPSMDSMGRTTLFRNSAAVREPVVAAMWSAAPTRACGRANIAQLREKAELRARHGPRRSSF